MQVVGREAVRESPVMSEYERLIDDKFLFTHWPEALRAPTDLTIWREEACEILWVRHRLVGCEETRNEGFEAVCC